MREFVGEVKDSLNKPLRPDMPVSTLLLIFVLFLVVGFIVFDTLKLIQQWATQAAAAVAS